LVYKNIQAKPFLLKCPNPVEEVFEYSAVTFTKGSSHFLVLSVYRNPDSSFKEFLSKFEQLLNRVTTGTQRMVVFSGDFNLDLLSSKKEVEDFKHLIESFGFKFNFHEPTRISKLTSTCIDNIITNFDPSKLNLYEPGLSDHKMLSVSFSSDEKSKMLGKSNIFKRRINEETTQQFVQKLINSEIENMSFISSSDVNVNYCMFSQTFMRIFEEAFPPKLSKQHVKPTSTTWMTLGIKKSCEHKRVLYEVQRDSDCPVLKAKFKTYCKVLKQVIKAAKRMANDRYISGAVNKSRAMWEVVRRETGQDKNTHPENVVLKSESKTVDNPKDVAETFNNYFINVADNLKSNPPEAMNKLINSTSMSEETMILNPTCPAEVLYVIKNLKNSKSTGWDEIPTSVIKASAEVIVKPITFLINQSFNTGIFPEHLKYAIIKPLHKHKDKTEVSNYRPIALLPVISKIFEKVFLARMLLFLDKNNILTPKQFGFRKNLSTETAIYSFVETVLQFLDKKFHVASVLCDLSKAFDCVDHALLLRKLKFYGIVGNSSKWLSSYLQNRKQKVVCTDGAGKTHSSTFQVIKRGVPQGSVLGPFLFLIYINDLPRTFSNAETVLFADDTTLVVADPNFDTLQMHITATLQEANDWFQANGLLLNSNKTQLIHFKTTPNQLEIKINDTPSVSSAKFLGVVVDENVKWKEHIAQLANRLSSACFAIKTLSKIVNIETIKAVYYAYAFSHLRYGVAFWGNSVNSITIFKIQKRIIRAMFNLKYRQSCKPYFKTYKILTLPSLYIFETLSLLAVNKDKALSTPSCPYSLRRNHLQYPTHRLTLYEDGAYYSAIKLYNRLPEDLKNIHSVTKFKDSLKSHLLNHAYYSVGEFLNG